MQGNGSESRASPIPAHDTNAGGAAYSAAHGASMHGASMHSDMPDDLVIVHVREGSEHQALLYLLRSVSRHFRLDDLLPEVPASINRYRYEIVREASGDLHDGDARSDFQDCHPPPGMLLRRLRVASDSDSEDDEEGGYDPYASSRPEGASPAPSAAGAASARSPSPGAYAAGPAAAAAAGRQHTLLGQYGGSSPQQQGRGSSSGPSPLPGHLNAAGAAQGRGSYAGTASSPSPAAGASVNPYAYFMAQQMPPPQQHQHHASHWGMRAQFKTPGRPRLLKRATDVSPNQARAWRRLAEAAPVAPMPKRPLLIPVAMPSMPNYLRMAADAIITFNSKGLMLTPYLDKTCFMVASATKIAAYWHGYHVRRSFQLAKKVIRMRAAKTIQHAWRAYLLRSRLRMLAGMRALVGTLTHLLLAGLVWLDVQSCEALRGLLTGGLQPVFPEHSIQFSFDPQGHVYVVAPLERLRPGLPAWVGAGVRVLRQQEAIEAYGKRQVFGRADALLLATQGAEWKDAGGKALDKGGLPEASKVAKSDEPLLQVTFPSLSEARARSCLLLALTFDPKWQCGAEMRPMWQHGQRGISPGGASYASTELNMHKWSSLNHTLSTSYRERQPGASTSGSLELVPGEGQDWTAFRMNTSRQAASRGQSRQRSTAGSQRFGSPSGSRRLSPAMSGASAAAGGGGGGGTLAASRSWTPSPVPISYAPGLDGIMPSARELQHRSVSRPRSQPVQQTGATALSRSPSRMGSPSRFSRAPSPGAAGMPPPALPPARGRQQQQPLLPRAASTGSMAPLGASAAASLQRPLSQGAPAPAADDAVAAGGDGAVPPLALEHAATATLALLDDEQQRLEAAAAAAEASSRAQSPRSPSEGAGSPRSLGGLTRPSSRDSAAAAASRSGSARKRRPQSSSRAPDLLPEQVEGADPDAAGVGPWQPPVPASWPESGAGQPPPSAGSLHSSSMYSSPANTTPMSMALFVTPDWDASAASRAQSRAGPETRATTAAAPLEQHDQQALGAAVDAARDAAGSPPPSSDSLQSDMRDALRTLTPNTRLLATVEWKVQEAMSDKHMVLLPVNLTGMGPGLGLNSPRRAGTRPPHPVSGGGDGGGEGGDNPELVVIPEPIYAVDVAEELQYQTYAQATLEREMRGEIDALVVRAREREHDRLYDRGHQLVNSQLVWVKHTDTGHSFAPDYVPLPPSAMARLVAEMREIYKAAAAQDATAQRQEHKAVMQEIAAERAEARQVAAQVNRRQAEVADTLKATYSQEVARAKRNRVTARAVREARKERQAHDRAFARAFVRQTGLLAQSVQKGERAILNAQDRAGTFAYTAHLRDRKLEGAANIAANKADMIATNKWKADVVRTTGYTKEIQEYQEAAEQYNHDVVALRRFEELERTQRVGPPGGVWGAGKPREALRAPYPTSTIVSASEAKQRTQQRKSPQQRTPPPQQQQQRNQQQQSAHASGTGYGGDAAAAAALAAAAAAAAGPQRQQQHRHSPHQHQHGSPAQQSQHHRPDSRDSQASYGSSWTSSSYLTGSDMAAGSGGGRSSIGSFYSSAASSRPGSGLPPGRVGGSIPTLPLLPAAALPPGEPLGSARQHSAMAQHMAAVQGKTPPGSGPAAGLGVQGEFRLPPLPSARVPSARPSSAAGAGSELQQLQQQALQEQQQQQQQALQAEQALQEQQAQGQPQYLVPPEGAEAAAELGAPDEGDDEVLVDYLPEMPYAQGQARMHTHNRRPKRPIGIVV